MRMFVKSVAWDFLLCVLASSAMAYTLCSGFYSTQPFQDPVGILATGGICAVIVAALSLSGYTNRARVIGSIGVGIAVCIALIVSFALSHTELPLEDVQGNYLYYALISCGSPIAVYVLSRSKAGCVTLLVLGMALCVVIEYLYWYGHVISCFIFAGASSGLIVFRSYYRNVLNSESERFAFNSVALSGIALSALALVCAVGVFEVAIAPIHPGHVEMKLITEHYRVDQLEVRGVGSAEAVEDDSLLSNNTNDDVSMTDDDSGQFDGQADSRDDSGDATASDVSENGFGASLSLRFPDYTIWVIVGILIALIVATIMAKLIVRRIRFANMASRPPDEAARSMFLFFVKRFSKLGIDVPGERTLDEYARHHADSFAQFERVQGEADFAQLIALYVESVYGSQPIDEVGLDLFKSYYSQFYRRARAYVGVVRYGWLFFVL